MLKHAPMKKNRAKIIIVSLSALVLVTAVIVSCLLINRNVEKEDKDELTLQSVDNMSFEIGEVPEKDISKYIWDKQFVQLSTADVVIDENWDKYIKIKDDYIMSNSFVDLSEMHNYFVRSEDKEEGNSILVNRAYSEVGGEQKSASVVTKDAEFAQSKLVVSTKYNKKNAYIKNIDFQAVVNISSGGLDNLIKKKSPNGKISLGNTYEEAKNILKNETKLVEDVQGDSITTFYLYESEHAELELRFTRLNSEDENKAILTGIKWTPTLISNKLNELR